MTPQSNPIERAAAGFMNMPAPAPIVTPPAKVALRMSYILNLSLNKADIIKAPIQLPDNAIIVFISIIVV